MNRYYIADWHPALAAARDDASERRLALGVACHRARRCVSAADALGELVSGVTHAASIVTAGAARQSGGGR